MTTNQEQQSSGFFKGKNRWRIAAIGILAAIILIVVAGFGFAYLQNPIKQYTGQPEPITIGTSPIEVSGLLFIAENQGFFEDNGLNATIKGYDAGALAMKDLEAGTIDIATSSELVFTRNVLNNKQMHGIASIGTSDFEYIIARKDSGIANVSDLKGKKIGVARGTSADFYLSRFLALNGINPQDVTIINLKPANMTEPLKNGEVDAVSTWDPYASAVVNYFGDAVLVWPSQEGQLMYWIANYKNDLLTDRPEIIVRFLRSLSQAEDFVVNHPDEAKKIVQNRLGSDDAYIDKIWPKTHLMLSLDQSLILAAEDETRWLIENNLTTSKEMPNYLEYFCTEDLLVVQPEAVKIIR